MFNLCHYWGDLLASDRELVKKKENTSSTLKIFLLIWWESFLYWVFTHIGQLSCYLNDGSVSVGFFGLLHVNKKWKKNIKLC